MIITKMEIWKIINGFDDYMVSNFGRVKSLNYNHTNQERILKPNKRKDGYLIIDLCKNGQRYKKYIHRLVAEAFIQNDDLLKTDINHKDENKENNHVDNLEWCDKQYNNDYSISRAVLQYDRQGNFIREWKSSMEIQRELGFNKAHISECCKNIPHHKTAYNFKWQYKYENE